MNDLLQRIEQLERSARRFRRAVLAVVFATLAGVGIAAAPKSQAVDVIHVTDKIVVGGDGKPTVALIATDGGAMVKIVGTDGKTRSELNFVEASDTTYLTVANNGGANSTLIASGKKEGGYTEGEATLRLTPAGTTGSTVMLMTGPKPFGMLAVRHPGKKGIVMAGYDGDKIMLEK